MANADDSRPSLPAIHGDDATSDLRPAGVRGFALHVLPALAWAFLVFVGGGAQLSPPPVDVGLPFDKVQHLVGFAVMQVLAFRALAYLLPERSRLRVNVLAAVGAILLGVLLELYQLGLPYRSAELADVVADAVGALLGAALIATRG